MEKYSKKNLKKIVKESFTYSEVSRKLNGNNYYGNRQTIKFYIKKYNIDISHFSIKEAYKKRRKSDAKSLDEILVSGSTYNHTSNLKNVLYKEELKKRECELCGQDEMWHEKRMSLILDHINGVNDDNRIENLRIVCPNCNATLDTHGGKNIKVEYIYSKEPRKKYYKPKTKEEVKESIINVSTSQRKVERPSYEDLIHNIKMFGYRGTGKKFGVSDNAIRKWKKFYEKYENAPVV